MSNYSSGGRGVKTALAILCVILALVLVLMIGATVWLEYTLGRIERTDDQLQDTMSPSQFSELLNETDPEDPTFTGPDLKDDEVTIPTIPADIIISDEDVVNILLVGQDRRKGQGRQRSDAMILCTINKEKKTLTMTSFMRDLYVQIPGLGGNKMNAAYQWGGMALLSETMILNFGIHVDAFVEVDFSGFTKVVDTLGGVEVTMSQREADYMNTFYWGAGIDNSNWNLTAGTHVLTGEQALSFSRIRKVPTINGTRDDFGRTERQRAVLNEVLRRCKTMDAGTAYALITDLIPIVKTDISKGEIINYFLTLFPLLAGTKIQTQRIPIDGSYELTWVGSLDVVLPDLEKNRQFLYDTLIPD